MLNNKIPLVLSISLFLLLAACGTKPAESAADRPVLPVTTVPAQPAPAFEDLAVSGVLASETEARLSFKTGGIIQKILVKEGDSFGAGALLASLNLTEISAQVDQAEEGLGKAQRDLARVQSLFADSAATREQLDNAQTGYQVALRTREIARYNLSFSEIRASGPGIVVKKLMNEGELAGPGSPVFLISGSAARDWVLRCRLSDIQWAKTALGDQASFAFDAYPGVSWVGTVSRRASGADASGLYQVDIQVQPGPRTLAAGLFGKGRLQVKSPEGGWRLPVQALAGVQRNRGRVFVVDEGLARPVDVTLVRWSDEGVLVDGELAGARVVVAGAPYLAGASAVSEAALP